MFIPDMPNVPPQDVPVMIAQANQAQSGDVKTTRSVGICHPVSNGTLSTQSLENVIDPIGEAKGYFDLYEHQSVTGSAIITVLQQPKHGILRLVTEADNFGIGRFDPTDPGYVYLPEKGYLGKDSATVLVEIGSIKVTVVYFFQAVNHPLGSYWVKELCGEKGYSWKISSTLDSNGNSTITSEKGIGDRPRFLLA